MKSCQTFRKATSSGSAKMSQAICGFEAMNANILSAKFSKGRKKCVQIKIPAEKDEDQASRTHPKWSENDNDLHVHPNLGPSNEIPTHANDEENCIHVRP
jgi:hypothetical protein